jgi:hypothetical protein
MGLILVAGATEARADATVWQGVGFIKTVTPACTTVPVAEVDDYYTVVYRPILTQIKQPGPEGLAFYTDRSSQVFNSPSSSKSLDGTGTYKGDGIGSHANSFAFAGTYALTISAVTPTTPIVTVDGTLTNFWDTAGCTVTFESVLGLRP